MHTHQKLPLDAYAGRWHVVASNFPMWLKGNKADPTFNYRVIGNAGSWALDDRVIYVRHGREKIIAGISRPTDPAATHFIWRGRGLLSLLSSRWQIFWPGEDRHVAVVVFEKTLLTPAGADILCRTAELSDALLHMVLASMSHHPNAAEHVGSIHRVAAEP